MEWDTERVIFRRDILGLIKVECDLRSAFTILDIRHTCATESASYWSWSKLSQDSRMRSPQRIQYIRDKTYLRYGERKLLVLELIKSGGRAKLFNGDVYPCCWADVLEESRLARPLALQIVRQIKSKVGCDPCLRQGKLPVYHALRGAFTILDIRHTCASESASY